MKKTFALIALGSISILSADQYGQTPGYQSGYCQSCNNGDYSQSGYNQGQPYNGGGYSQNQPYYNQGQYQGQSNNGYYPQRNDQYSQPNNPYNSQQQAPRNQPYGQNQQYDQNQPYYQQQNNQSDNQGLQGNGNNKYANQNGNDQKVVTDQEITKNIRTILSSGWFSDGFQGVNFDVNNGNVNLRGSVDTLQNKTKLEDSVRKVDGVKQVNNQITIAKADTKKAYTDSQLQESEKKFPRDIASTSSDRQINAKIRERLNGSYFSKGFEMLVVKTANGVVIISGTVNKSDDIQKINDQLKGIEGVKSVNNQLSVQNK